MGQALSMTSNSSAESGQSRWWDPTLMKRMRPLGSTRKTLGRARFHDSKLRRT